MNSGKISYSPDYNFEEPDLPDDWGLMEAACADGHHRYLPDAPRCGCGAMINREAERARLERAVIETSKAARLAEHEHTKDFTLETWEAMVSAGVLRDSAVDDLLAFEEGKKS